VLLETGALTELPGSSGVRLTPLGRTAAQLQAENVLWAAQVTTRIITLLDFIRTG